MKLTCAIALVLLTAAPAIAQIDLSDSDLLSALDEARFPAADVKVLRVRIASSTPDATREAEILLQFGQIDAKAVARIEFLAPAEMAGQIYLSTPDATYFFGPDLASPIKTSATTEVFGDSAVAQTSGIRFLSKYTIAARRTVQATDGADLLELDLVAVDYTVAFQAITVRVDPITLRPVSATLFAVSGLPFYDVTYRDYVTRENGDVYVSVQEIANRLFLGRVTTSEILEATAAELPAALFDPASLGPSP
ncbi:MAG: outer membrane lipoprotein-sorting protein [bacterium]